MKRILMITGLILAACIVAFSQRGPRGGFRGGYPTGSLPAANSEPEKKVLAVLDEAQRTGAMYLNVPVTDGRMLRLLAEAAGAKNVVEVGTSTGLSGLWLCLALQKTGGKLTTFEYDAGRAATARGHFKKAGVDPLVTVVEGDAHQTIARLKEPIDVLFIDADKEGYVDGGGVRKPLRTVEEDRRPRPDVSRHRHRPTANTCVDIAAPRPGDRRLRNHRVARRVERDSRTAEARPARPASRR
jgi:hypothetical protein